MTIEIPRQALKGNPALVVGIANEHSIAYGWATAFRELGANLTITYFLSILIAVRNCVPSWTPTTPASTA